LAVEDDVVAVREDALDLAVRVRMIGEDPGDELAQALHTVLNERIVLAIAAAGIEPERVLNVAFKDRFLVEGDGIGMFASDMVVPFRSFSPIHDNVAEEAALEFAPAYSGRKGCP
jgi:hypothetical protein